MDRLEAKTNFIASLTLCLFQGRVIFERHFFSMRRPFVLTGIESGLDVRAVICSKSWIYSRRQLWQLSPRMCRELRKKDILSEVLRLSHDRSLNKYADVDDEDDFQVFCLIPRMVILTTISSTGGGRASSNHACNNLPTNPRLSGLFTVQGDLWLWQCWWWWQFRIWIHYWHIDVIRPSSPSYYVTD